MSDMKREQLVGKLVKERPWRCRTVYEVRAVEDFGGKAYALLVWETSWNVPKARWLPLHQLQYYLMVGDVETGRLAPCDWKEVGSCE